MKIRGGREN